MRMFSWVSLALIAASISRADVKPDFEEEYVCRTERNDAKVAADRVPPAPNDTAALAVVERRRADLARATKGQEKFQRALDEAIANVERVRTAWRADVAKRDASAKALADCVDREQQAHNVRTTTEAIERRKADEAALERERLQKLLSDKPVVRLALSALVCVTNEDRANTLRAIADEKKYARIGGVQNLTKLHELQEQVRAADQRKARVSRELKARKLSAIKCSDAKVKLTATCINRTRSAIEGACLEVADPLRLVEAADF